MIRIAVDHYHYDHCYQQADDNGVIRIVVPFNSRKQGHVVGREFWSYSVSMALTMGMIIMSMMIIEWGKRTMPMIMKVGMMICGDISQIVL